MGKNHRPILMMLKTPPPYGGGELRSVALSAYISGDSDFVVQEIRSMKRNKTNQGEFAYWKLIEFIVNWWHFVCLIRHYHPRLIFCPIAKTFPVFLRDSIYYWTAMFFKIPVASELAGETFYFIGKGRFSTWYGRIVISRLVCLRVLGKSIAQRLAEFGINKTIITDNGIKCEAAHGYLPLPEDGIMRLIFVGTHSTQKGFDQLVEACVILARKGLVFKVHTLGEWISDGFRDMIQSKLNDNGLTSRFVFHGLIHSSEKWAIFAKSQILVLPSNHEGQPLVILEALACGIPVVASHVGAIPDTIEHGINGFLVSPGVPKELAERLENLMTNPELLLKMSLANLQKYKQRFTQNMFLKTQLAWIRACASGELVPTGQKFTAD